jgi:hypothetical protein
MILLVKNSIFVVNVKKKKSKKPKGGKHLEKDV